MTIIQDYSRSRPPSPPFPTPTRPPSRSTYPPVSYRFSVSSPFSSLDTLPSPPNAPPPNAPSPTPLSPPPYAPPSSTPSPPPFLTSPPLSSPPSLTPPSPPSRRRR